MICLSDNLEKALEAEFEHQFKESKEEWLESEECFALMRKELKKVLATAQIIICDDKEDKLSLFVSFGDYDVFSEYESIKDLFSLEPEFIERARNILAELDSK